MTKTNKIILFITLIIVLAIMGLITPSFLEEDLYGDAHIEQPDGSIIKLNDLEVSGPQNAAYRIVGEQVVLVDGFAEKESAPGSASKVTTTYFGNEVRTDLNDDGREDVVFLLTQNTGGTGTFFYVVAALNTEDGWKGSRGLLLGDRIAPQTIEMSQNPNHQNVIVVNYVDRATGQSMSEQPSVGKSIWLKLDPETMAWGEIEQTF